MFPRLLYLLVASVLTVGLLGAADAPAPQPRLVAQHKTKSDPIPDGGYVDFTIEVPKGASVIWRISPAPVQRTTGLPAGRLIFGGKKGTTYVATAIIVDFDKKEVTDADYEFVFGGVAPPPPKKDPPKVDPPAPSDTFYFLIVRANGPATSLFTKIMADPAWQTLRMAGHLVKDKTVDEAKLAGVVLPNDAPLPAVAILREDAATKSSKVLKVVALPSGSAILDLPKAVK